MTNTITGFDTLIFLFMGKIESGCVSRLKKLWLTYYIYKITNVITNKTAYIWNFYNTVSFFDFLSAHNKEWPRIYTTGKIVLRKATNVDGGKCVIPLRKIRWPWNLNFFPLGANYHYIMCPLISNKFCFKHFLKFLKPRELFRWLF